MNISVSARRWSPRCSKPIACYWRRLACLSGNWFTPSKKPPWMTKSFSYRWNSRQARAAGTCYSVIPHKSTNKLVTSCLMVVTCCGAMSGVTADTVFKSLHYLLTAWRLPARCQQDERRRHYLDPVSCRYHYGFFSPPARRLVCSMSEAGFCTLPICITFCWNLAHNKRQTT